MAGTLLGVDMGSGGLKLALCRPKERMVKETAVARLPADLLENGRVSSPDAVGELIRNTCQENGIRASRAALVLPAETAHVRNVTMPRMNVKQLLYNLPYEFGDSIKGSLKDYVFDYAMLTDLRREAVTPTMDLLAAAVPARALEDGQRILRRAGLKMVKAAPAQSAYIALIRIAESVRRGSGSREYGILDLGRRAVRLHIFRGERHRETRILSIGLSALDRALAEAYHIDETLSHTYLVTNHDDCQGHEACRAVYTALAEETAEALGAYRSGHPDSQLSDIWLSGGGAEIAALRAAVSGTLEGIRTHGAEELVQGGGGVENCSVCLQAIGITMD